MLYLPFMFNYSLIIRTLFLPPPWVHLLIPSSPKEGEFSKLLQSYLQKMSSSLVLLPPPCLAFYFKIRKFGGSGKIFPAILWGWWVPGSGLNQVERKKLQLHHCNDLFCCWGEGLPHAGSNPGVTEGCKRGEHVRTPRRGDFCFHMEKGCGIWFHSQQLAAWSLCFAWCGVKRK